MIEIKRGKIISYFIFVAIATLFWISTVLNKKSSYTKDIWIELLTPDSLIILNNNIYQANVTLEGKGVDLIFENRHTKNKPLKIHISSNKKMVTGDDILKYLSAETSKLNIDIQNIIFSAKALSIDRKITKKIPIKINSKFFFDHLFGLKSEVYVEPDSITVTGPKSYITKIDKWNTINKVYNKLSHSIKEKIELRKPVNSKIHLNREEVFLSIPVEQYTEKKLILPIKIEGHVQNDIELLPPYVEVSFLIGLSKFDNINPHDFRANIYIGEDSLKSVSYPVSIIDKPKLVSIQYIRPNYVDVYLKND